ncbi:MAG: primosomal protein N' [Planctomycetes bacterium]|nr:primosomal protein N' [Planctomycetota bacterium]HPY75224.1 primosomal protein N' [Planctomycetota bacterium]HQB00506.1 primosomal protein N' [Planctomycetota bacterium]
MLYCQVAVPLPLCRLFDYKVPSCLLDKVKVGIRVRVPFRKKTMTGFIVSLSETSDVPDNKCRTVLDVVDEFPVVSQNMLEFCQWWSSYYQCSLGEALDVAVPTQVKSSLHRPQAFVQIIDKESVDDYIQNVQDKYPQQAKILRILKSSEEPLLREQIRNKLGISLSPFQTLAKHGIIEIFYQEVEFDLFNQLPPSSAPIPELTYDQKSVLIPIYNCIRAEKYRTFLLLGVTGSGKTEIYLRAIHEVVEKGKEAIVLVPEIALTPQTVSRFKQRFDHIAVLHSELTSSQRAHQWQLINEGKIQVVIGPRSALFAPTHKLGIIIVDEEHENTFKQQNSPRYHARDLAVKRGHQENAVVILGSATPSLESYYNALKYKYTLLQLSQRIQDKQMPTIRLVDMREEAYHQKRLPIFSRALIENIRKTLHAGNQVILFLNRRGFAPTVRCPLCHFELRCSHCEINMTYHENSQRAMCHYCGEEITPPSICPICQHPKIRYLGIGTERLEHALKKIFPEAIICRMDSDTMTTRQQYEKNFIDFSQGKIDILLGTQMIAKGLDFPKVTLVGILAADSSLQLPDFRAAERTFQLTVQVAGRAGRGESPGLVILQTNSPSHYAIQTALTQNYISFAEQELAFRKQLNYPPYGKLLRVLLEGANEEEVQAKAEQICELCQFPNVEILGPVPTPIPKIKDRFRYHILIKAMNSQDIHQIAKKLQAQIQISDKIRIHLDVDPIHLL